MDFQERFRGKVSTMTKGGVEKMIENSMTPINKSASRETQQVPDSSQYFSQNPSNQPSRAPIWFKMRRDQKNQEFLQLSVSFWSFALLFLGFGGRKQPRKEAEEAKFHFLLWPKTTSFQNSQSGGQWNSSKREVALTRTLMICLRSPNRQDCLPRQTPASRPT